MNRQIFVRELVNNRGLLQALSGALFSTVKTTIDASGSPSNLHPIDLVHPVIRKRRYSPVIGDFKCVLNVKGISKKFCLQDTLNVWLDTLNLLQFMNPQVWVDRRRYKVEYENKVRPPFPLLNLLPESVLMDTYAPPAPIFFLPPSVPYPLVVDFRLQHWDLIWDTL